MSWLVVALFPEESWLWGSILGCSTIAGDSRGLWVKGTEGNDEGKVEQTEGNAVSETETL